MKWLQWRAMPPAGLALADQFIVSGSNFVSVVLIGRFLSVESFGQFSLAYMSTMFMASLHRAALTQPFNVLGAGNTPELLAARLGALLRVQALAALCAGAGIAIASSLFFPDLALVLAAIAFVICFFLQETLRRYWYTCSQVGQALRNDAVSYLGQLLVLAGLAVGGRLTAVSALLGMGATSLLAFLLARRKMPVPAAQAPGTTGRLLAEHWPLARWLVPTTLAVWGAGQVYPFLMVGLGPKAVGAFAACRTVLNAVGPLVQSVGNYLPVRATALLRRGGVAALRKDMMLVCSAATLGAVVFVLALQWFAQPLLALLYGGQYDHAASILRVLALGTVPLLLGSILGAYALALEDSRSGFFSNLGASVTTFTVGIWLINRFDIVGTAWGTVISISTAMALQAGFLWWRLRHFRA